MKKNTKSKNRRPQAQKARNEAMMRGMQEIRFSNAAGPHKSAKAYNRNDKSWKKGF